MQGDHFFGQLSTHYNKGGEKIMAAKKKVKKVAKKKK